MPVKAKQLDKAEVEVPEIQKQPVKKKLKAKSFDQSQYVTVRNGFQGRLVYKSGKTGERFVWDGFGAEQDMEFMELKSARNSGKNFFINNWFMFDDPSVIEELGMQQYYSSALSIEEFDTLFDNSVDDVVRIINGLSDGQKKSVAYKAKQMINDGTIDSIKMISAIEEALCIELVEK